MLLCVPSEKVFDLLICRTKEQKARLQYLANAMPKSVMPSATKKRKVSKEKKLRIMAVLVETPRLKRFFQQSFSSSNVKTVALTRAPENVGENHDISFETPFTFSLAGHIDMLFSSVFVCISGFCLLFGWMLFLAEPLSSLWKYFS